MDLKKAVYSLHPLARRVLPHVEKHTVDGIASSSSLRSEEVSGALHLLAEMQLVTISQTQEQYACLDTLGKRYAGADLPEVVFLKKLVTGPVSQKDVGLTGVEFSSALGFLKRNGLVEIQKSATLTFVATEKAAGFLGSYVHPLERYSQEVLVSRLGDVQKNDLPVLVKRGLVKLFNKKSITATVTAQGKEVLSALQTTYKDLELVDVLTPDMLKDGSWQHKEFRHYQVDLAVPTHAVGRRHPMKVANNILRDIFVEMGFCEMAGPMVESAFWNMDVMWIPQDHPARDDQDTFYLEGSVKSLPANLVAAYKKMHEEGLVRSHTTPGSWSEEVASKRLLRTHSTATSFRTLACLAAKGDLANGKYFYCANNFRNEAVDATHLNDFFQAEGFIIGDNLSLADLMGFVKEFYAKLGIHKIRFKPTFNPYTEPSMEAHYYDPVMKKWYALINSGIFRAETLQPLGITKTIIAWGMGASRVAALLAKKHSMRELTGASCDFGWLTQRPLMQREIVRE